MNVALLLTVNFRFESSNLGKRPKDETVLGKNVNILKALPF